MKDYFKFREELQEGLSDVLNKGIPYKTKDGYLLPSSSSTYIKMLQKDFDKVLKNFIKSRNKLKGFEKVYKKHRKALETKSSGNERMLNVVRANGEFLKWYRENIVDDLYNHATLLSLVDDLEKNADLTYELSYKEERRTPKAKDINDKYAKTLDMQMKQTISFANREWDKISKLVKNIDETAVKNGHKWWSKLGNEKLLDSSKTIERKEFRQFDVPVKNIKDDAYRMVRDSLDSERYDFEDNHFDYHDDLNRAIGGDGFPWGDKERRMKRFNSALEKRKAEERAERKAKADRIKAERQALRAAKLKV
jgi:hypothetical protein